MLRYFACSVRNFRQLPDLSDHRMNWEIWVTLSGRVRPRFHDAPDRVVPDANFWVMPPGTRYRWLAETEKVERAVFHFAYVPHELEQVAKLRGYFCRQLADDELDEVRAIAKVIGAAQQQHGRLRSLFFQRGALDLALIALREETERPVSTMDTWAADRAERAVGWYSDNLREAPKFSQVAAAMKISVSHLRRLFQTHYGESPKTVFDKLRVHFAAGLLAGSTSTLDDVASQSGFQSTSDFCRVFKRHYGYPPNVWRRTVGKFDSNLVPKDAGIREVDLQRLVSRVLAIDSQEVKSCTKERRRSGGSKLQSAAKDRVGSVGYGTSKARARFEGSRDSRRSDFGKSRVSRVRPSLISTTPVR